MKERSGMPYDVVAFETDECAFELSAEEEGIFHRMMRKAWINGSVPADLTALAGLCRVRPSTLRKAWPNLSKMWSPMEDNPSRLQNKKQESERIFKEKIRAANSIAGKLSAKAKKEKEVASMDVQRTDNERLTSPPLPSPSPSSLINNSSIPDTASTVKRPAVGFGQDVFDKVWMDYPNRDGRKVALRHFQASVRTEQDLESCLTALFNYKAHLARHPTKPVKNGSTWFCNWRDWVEWVEPVVSTNGNGNHVVTEADIEAARLRLQANRATAK